MKYPAAVGLVVLALLPGCRNKEQPAPLPSAVPPPAATAPTTTTTTLPPPPPAWRGARWGMTKDEVLATFPGEATRLAQPAPFGPATPGSSDVAIPAWDGAGAQFRVLFGFDGPRLGRVHLNAIKPGDNTCGDVEKSLTAELGAPAGRNNTGTSLRGEEIVWKHPDHTITLSCAGVHSLGFRSVTLAYRPPA